VGVAALPVAELLIRLPLGMVTCTTKVKAGPLLAASDGAVAVMARSLRRREWWSSSLPAR
jgi:hypothetical protein